MQDHINKNKKNKTATGTKAHYPTFWPRGRNEKNWRSTGATFTGEKKQTVFCQKATQNKRTSDTPAHHSAETATRRFLLWCQRSILQYENHVKEYIYQKVMKRHENYVLGCSMFFSVNLWEHADSHQSLSLK